MAKLFQNESTIVLYELAFKIGVDGLGRVARDTVLTFAPAHVDRST